MTARPMPQEQCKTMKSPQEQSDCNWLFDYTLDENIPNAFSRDGFVCLSQAIKSEILDEWHQWSLQHFCECFETLFEQGYTLFPQHCTTHNGGNVEYALKAGAKNGFREVVMRSPGRYELSLLHCPSNERPSLDPILKVLEPVIPPLLEESTMSNIQMCHVSLLMATPGALEQSWHSDGGHVSLSQHLPCHVLNVFIPLVNVPLELGPTELRPASHYLTRNLARMMLIAKAKKSLCPPVIPALKRGDVLVFDYRILHRGRANQSSTRNRPILVLTFAKKWFVDVCNFPKRSMHETNSRESHIREDE
jgi:ectoine hydroxylase-related dioxygenase (phytanoyl-CoA dioxygenase family)